MRIQLLRCEFLRDQSANLSGGCERVAKCKHFNVFAIEGELQRAKQTFLCEPPQFSPSGIRHTDMRNSDEKRSCRFQDSKQFLHHELEIEDHVEDMCTNNRIELIAWKVVGFCQIGNDSRLRVAGVSMENVDSSDSIRSISR